ncbi:MAG: hypothetical protein WC824_10440 [Bacteroidota bacterium]|jgi:hypothetical protein
MKRSLFLLAFLMLMPVLAGAQQVTFSMKAPPEGTTRAVVDSMELIFIISVNMEGEEQSFNVMQAWKKAYVETILAVEGTNIMKRSVAFTEASERGTQPMQESIVKALPIKGKSYLLEFIGDSLAVTGEDGSIVSEEEHRELAGRFRKKSDGQFGSILDGRTMSIGEEVELTDDMLQQFGSDLTRGPMKPKTAKIKLVSLGESQGMKTALLDITVSMAGAQGIMEMEFTMKGTAEIGVDNLWPLALIMTGTVSGAGSHSGMPLTADGDMRMALIATYK